MVFFCFPEVSLLLIYLNLLYYLIIIKRIMQSVFSITGKANLERTDLEPALKALKERLMTKNVVRVCTAHRFLCVMFLTQW